MPSCLNCGSELIWQADFNGEDYGYEEEGMVTVWDCPSCGAEHQVFVPTNFNPEGNERD